MDAILELFSQDFSSLIIGIFILMSSAIAIYKIISEFFAMFGKPIGAIKQRKVDHDLLIKTVKDLSELHNKHEEDTKQSIEHDKAIRNDLEKLTRLFIDKEIDDMRWEILNFSSALSSGRQYNKESFEHVIQIHEKYEKILREHNMENGQVTASIEFIVEEYKYKLRNGF